MLLGVQDAHVLPFGVLVVDNLIVVILHEPLVGRHGVRPHHLPAADGCVQTGSNKKVYAIQGRLKIRTSRKGVSGFSL